MVWSILTLLCCGSTVLWEVAEPGVRVRLQEAVSQRYKLVVKRYSDSAEWLHTLDRVHSYVGCCGIDNYSDWYSTSWLPLSHLPGDPALYTKEVQPNGRVLVPLVPTSCCRVPSPDCGHLTWLQANRSWAGLRPADPSLLHTEGCAPAMTRLFVIDIMLCRLLVLAVVALQVVMLVMTRYVWSATYNGILLGRPGGAAPGWLVTGLLHRYNKNCGDGKVDNLENHVDKKHRWRCIDKCRGREGKGADCDGVPRSKSNRFRSPCIEKLKQKFKGTNKSKQNGDSKTNLNVETDYDTEDEENIHNDTPNRDAQARSKSKYDHLSYEENESLPLLSKHQNVQVFDIALGQKSPFVADQSTANTSPLQNHESIKYFNNSEFVKPKAVLSRSSFDKESEKDFKKTRSLFENAAKRVSPRKFNVRKHTQQQSVHVVQFEDSVRSKQKDQESEVQLGDSYSPRSEQSSIPVVLRNYRIPPEV